MKSLKRLMAANNKEKRAIISPPANAARKANKNRAKGFLTKEGSIISNIAKPTIKEKIVNSFSVFISFSIYLV